MVRRAVGRNRVWRVAMLLGVAWASIAHAETLTFDAAVERLMSQSEALAAARAGLASKTDTAEATRSLDLPTVSLDAQMLRYQKTLESDSVTLDSLSVGSISLPTNLDVPNVQARITQNSFRPTVSGLWSIYSGGKISAVQQAAQAAVAGANAELSAVRQTVMVQLVQLYFGQQLAQKVVQIRRDVRDGLDQHLQNAIKLEQGGLITKAQRLQAQVAFDATQREYQRALHDLDSATVALTQLLHAQGTTSLATPLFMVSRPVGVRDDFLTASGSNPAVLQLQAMQSAAQQKVKIEEASWLPQLYLFGSYNLNRHQELPIEPDWIVGVGLHFPLFAGLDRNRSISAARSDGIQVNSMLDAARNTLTVATHKAWNDVETARQQFELLGSNLESAQENLRAQELAFREGQGTSTDVVDARLLLGHAQVEQAQAAYLFDLALARLLDAAGQINTYPDYVRKADKVID